MTQSTIAHLSQLGEAADRLYTQGKYREALAAYQTLHHEFESMNHVDSYLLSKLTLGLMRTFIKAGRFKAAFELWTVDLEDSLYGVGIYGLENAQASVEDLVAYDFICAFLHSISEESPHVAGRAVNTYMSRICEHALEHGDRELYHRAISNWKAHMKEIFQMAIPREFAEALIHAEQEYGDIVRPGAIDFPGPTAWERPHHFQEMSRVVQMKTHKKTGSTGRHSSAGASDHQDAVPVRKTRTGSGR